VNLDLHVRIQLLQEYGDGGAHDAGADENDVGLVR
jgi:hypothetical protein